MGDCPEVLGKKGRGKRKGKREEKLRFRSRKVTSRPGVANWVHSNTSDLVTNLVTELMLVTRFEVASRFEVNTNFFINLVPSVPQ